MCLKLHPSNLTANTEIKRYIICFNVLLDNLDSRKLQKQPHSPSSLLFPPYFFRLPLMLTANVLPTSSCACCLIAEPPSPRPRDPPGSMYHLLHHLSLASSLSSSCSFPHLPAFFSLCLFATITLQSWHPSQCTNHFIYMSVKTSPFRHLYDPLKPYILGKVSVCVLRVRQTLFPAFQPVATAVQCYTLVRCGCECLCCSVKGRDTVVL